MVTIYLNQWFSTVREHLEYLREDFSDIRIIGSGRAETPYRTLCDEFIVEPKFESTSERIQFYLDICEREKVDFLFTYKWLEEINEHREEFEKLGTTLVLPEDKELVKILNNKVSSAEYFNSLNIPDFKVPETIPCNTFEELKAAVDLLKETYEEVCVKYAEDIGGRSYSKIIDKRDYKNLYSDFTRRITMEELEEMYKNNEHNRTIAAMPYLNGEEISIDCINTKDGFIGVSRRRNRNERVDRLTSEGPDIEMARKISEALNIDTPFNIQFRYLDGHPYILEINTRIAGGSHKSKFIGAKFLSIYLKEKLGMENNVELKDGTIFVTKISTAMVYEGELD